MFPELNLKRVDRELSNDWIAHTSQWAIILAVAIYYTASYGYNTPRAYWLYVILAVAGFQSISRFLPVMRDWSWLDSAGIGAQAIFNLVTAALFIWFVPLFSPFILIFPVVMFITVYYHGVQGLAIAALIQIGAVTVGTLQGGSQQFGGFGWAYPILIVLLNFTFGVIVQRAYAIDRRVRRRFRQVSKSVELEREQLRSLINSMADAVVAIDARGAIQFYNGATLILLNTNMSLEGKHL